MEEKITLTLNPNDVPAPKMDIAVKPGVGEAVEQAMQQAAAFGVLPQTPEKRVDCTHIFTHIRWEMTGYTIRCGAAPDRFVWAAREALDREYALPTAFRIFLGTEESSE